MAIHRAGGEASPEALGARIHGALAALRHRGPDGAGIWISPDACTGLGSTRLAVMGVDNGRQPLANEAGSVRAVVNGEFYDFEPLRAGLEERGHVFRTCSDSELLVHLYEEHGVECVRHLRGEFAFILWDAVNQRLVAARDRFGIKPLCYARDGGEWLLASEIKALLAAGVQARWDEEALLHCLAHQYPRGRETLFAGVRQVAPAHVLVVDEHGAKEMSYWQTPFLAAVEETSARSMPAGEVRAMLEAAVRLRLRCDVPLACTLSGGLDSNAVAMIAAQQRQSAMDCFCVRFDAPGYDEGPQVLSDASLCKERLRVHEVPVRRRDLATHLQSAVRHSEGLAINGQLVGKYLLSRAINQAGFKVVLAGEGADEAFLGYSHLQEDHAQSTGVALGGGFALQRGVMLPMAGESAVWQTPEWLERVPAFLQAKLATGRHFAPLLNETSVARFDPQRILDGTLADLAGSDAMMRRPCLARQSSWLWSRMALATYILRTLGDGAEMAHSVEARLPFLDHVLFEKAARVPVAALIDGSQSKVLLREALRGVLPEPVRTRPKHPFLAPPLLADGDPMVRDFVHDTLRSEACRSLPLIDHRAVLDWSEDLGKLPPEKQTRLDPVLMLRLTATLLQKSYSMT